MKFSFKRIISTGKFIPEIDGLRFLAIISVVILHLRSWLIKHYNFSSQSDVFDFSFFDSLTLRGDIGVKLFFIISGFILAIPFANFYLLKEIKVNLKNYFLRRLTRLEPPYVIVMTTLLLFYVYVVKSISMFDGLLRYLSSVFYVHNFVYPDQRPFLNGVAWSLEIEVQFYILAPIVALIFLIKDTILRRSLVIIIIIFSIYFNFFILKLKFISIINFFHFFLVGFLLADLYVTKYFIFNKTKLDSFIAILILVSIFLFRSDNFDTTFQKFIFELVRLNCIFIFLYFIIFHKALRFFSYKIITNIGGMCYSIYLLHVPIIIVFGKLILKFSFSNHNFINISIYSILIIAIIILISSLFFLFVERPCMDKNCIKKLFKNKNDDSKDESTLSN
jgi:peptidoglycan/LPS O-acetylase OafA/YrhL